MENAHEKVVDSHGISLLLFYTHPVINIDGLAICKLVYS